MAVKSNRFEEGTLPETLVELLTYLASKWGDVLDLRALKVTHLSGSMTNEFYRISWPSKIQKSPRTVLVRTYGKGVDILFDRGEEFRTFEILSASGYVPKHLGRFWDESRFRNGRVEQFIYARTLSASGLHVPEISALIATKMREFHSLNIPRSKTVILWDRLRNWLGQAKRLCSPEDLKEFHFDNLENEINLLEKAISSDHHEIGFCHNDLQYGNIMYKGDSKSLYIINYEYASYNPVAYDIANHFCEMAANYHTETPHILDYSKYPCLARRKRFIHQYLISAGNQSNDTDVEQLADDVEKYTLANHIFWGLWGIISAHVNSIEFDYKEYARQRFEQYRLRKPEILGDSREDVLEHRPM